MTFDIHTLYYASLAVVVGFHSMLFWVFAKIYGMREGLVPPDPWFHRAMRPVTLETGLITGGVLLVLGIGMGAFALRAWSTAEFGALQIEHTMRLVIASGTAILLAFQVGYGAFFISILEVRAQRR